MTDQKDGRRKNDREFLLGVLWSVWWLHSAHGEDTYAQDLLLESVGSEGVRTVQMIAHTEQYRFKRGFWAAVNRRKATR